jgi:hypothetical protein
VTFVVIGIQEQVLHILSTIVVLDLPRSLWLGVLNLMSRVVAELIVSFLLIVIGLQLHTFHFL